MANGNSWRKRNPWRRGEACKGKRQVRKTRELTRSKIKGAVLMAAKNFRTIKEYTAAYRVWVEVSRDRVRAGEIIPWPRADNLTEEAKQKARFQVNCEGG